MKLFVATLACAVTARRTVVFFGDFANFLKPVKEDLLVKSTADGVNHV